MQDNLQIRFLFLPDGEDPDSLVRKEGKSAFESRLTSALSLSAFFFQTLSRQSDLATIEGRAGFTANALNFIKQVQSEILPEILLEELAKRARIDITELKQQIKKPAQTKANDIHVPEPDLTKPKLKAPIQTALALLVQYPSLASSMTDPIPEGNLPGLQFMQHLLEIIQQTPGINTATLVEIWRGQKEERFVAHLACLDHRFQKRDGE